MGYSQLTKMAENRLTLGAADACRRRSTRTLGAGREIEREMSPTVLREGGFRFYFFSREEPRAHVHVYCGDGEAKFWLEPAIELAQNYGLDDPQLRLAEEVIRTHQEVIRAAWRKHFGS